MKAANENATAAEPCSPLFLFIFLHSGRFPAATPPSSAPTRCLRHPWRQFRPTPRRKEKRHHIHPSRIFKLFGASFGQTIWPISRSGVELSSALPPNVAERDESIDAAIPHVSETYRTQILTILCGTHL